MSSHRAWCACLDCKRRDYSRVEPSLDCGLYADRGILPRWDLEHLAMDLGREIPPQEQRTAPVLRITAEKRDSAVLTHGQE